MATALKRLDEQYVFTEKTPILDNLNRVLAAIESRISPLESIKTELDASISSLTGVALDRLNNIFTPLILEAQNRLERFGAAFATTSTTELEVSLGVKYLTIAEEDWESYVFADYTAIQRVGGTESMIAHVDSFDRESGQLAVTVIQINGTGTFDDWRLTLTAEPDLAHAGRTDNPHETTALQVGAYTTGQVDALLDDLTSGIYAALAAEQDARQAADLNEYNNRIASFFASGTAMVFFQATAPSGWTKSTTHNNKAIRIVSGTSGGNSGGSVDFSVAFGRSGTDDFTLGVTHLAAHAHGYSDPTHAHNYNDYFAIVGAPYWISGPGLGADMLAPTYTNGDTPRTTYGAYAGITISNAGGNSPHSHPMDMRVKYVDAIICTRD